MIAALLALAAACLYGTGDFVGGVAARRSTVLGTVVISKTCGLVLLLIAAPAWGAPALTPADLAWGAGGGVASVFGVTLLYGALAIGRMTVVAPVTALCAIVLPVLAGLAFGEHLAPAALVGIALATLAVWLISRGSDGEVGTGGPHPVSATGIRALVMAFGAGVAIAAFYVCLQQTPAGAGLWPLTVAGAVSTAALAVCAGFVVRRQDWRLDPAWLLPALLSGGCDIVANILYLVAVRDGMLAVIAPLASLYPASTVLLARFLLRERLRRMQCAGLAAAGLAIGLITAG